MAKSKTKRGLCDVEKCYKPIKVVWTTGGGTKILVCTEHDQETKAQMGTAYNKMKPKPAKNLPCLTCKKTPCTRKPKQQGCKDIGE